MAKLVKCLAVVTFTAALISMSGFAQAQENTSSGFEIIKTPNVINKVDLTGHGRNDLVIEAYRDARTARIEIYTIFLVDLSFDPAIKADHSPLEEQQLMSIYEANGQSTDFAVEEWGPDCWSQETGLYRLNGVKPTKVLLVKAQVVQTDSTAPGLNADQNKLILTEYELRETSGADRGGTRFSFEAVGTRTIEGSFCTEDEIAPEMRKFAQSH